jgi:hypothetical protein
MAGMAGAGQEKVCPALAAAVSTRYPCDHDSGTRHPHLARHHHRRGLKEPPCLMPVASSSPIGDTLPLRGHKRLLPASAICDTAISVDAP